MKKNRSYSAELKQEAVKMVIELGLTREEVSQRLMIPKGTIGNWITAERKGKNKAEPGEL